MEERLLFDRIALHAANVSPGNVQLSPFIEANLANASLALFDETAMTTRIALQCVAGEMFGKFNRPFRGHLVQNFSE